MFSDPEWNRNATPTDSERTPNGSQTEPERILNGSQTDPERISNGPRTDPERIRPGLKKNEIEKQIKNAIGELRYQCVPREICSESPHEINHIESIRMKLVKRKKKNRSASNQKFAEPH